MNLSLWGEDFRRQFGSTDFGVVHANGFPYCLLARRAIALERGDLDPMKAASFVAFSLLVILAKPVLADGLRLTGSDLSSSHPQYAERMNQIWRFVAGDLAQIGDWNVPAPEVHVEPFARDQQSPEWTAWQNQWIVEHPDIWLEWTDVKGTPRAEITPAWIRAHLADLYPFPLSFRGFHYDGSDKIQVNPVTTFLAFYQNDPYGVKKDFVGYGYYVSGHELTHYALAQRGIPDRLHHCLYVLSVDGHPSLMERLAAGLISRGFASGAARRVGLEQEIGLDPCSRLSAGDRADATKYAFQLSRE